MNLFTETNLSPDILKAIGELGYESPTEIQKQTIPFILSDSRLDRTCADGDRQNSSIFASDFGYD